MIIEDTTEPTVAPLGWYTERRRNQLIRAHREVRSARYQNDYADAWPVKKDGECQGKTAWIMDTLGWEEHCRGYVAGLRPVAVFSKAQLKAVPWLRDRVILHAFFAVRVTTPLGNVITLVADIRHPTLSVLEHTAEYLDPRPRVRYVSKLMTNGG